MQLNQGFHIRLKKMDRTCRISALLSLLGQIGGIAEILIMLNNLSIKSLIKNLTQLTFKDRKVRLY
ncbi:hypothetical protein HMPREF9998_01155 [Peptostreptococcus anaerobius VPI 4330 = DSM 2949]|nr:hypothetical protein HMPREF9998_01155 [Peptostreptococcus anaerobius VPI 4330 = DSM 2949]